MRIEEGEDAVFAHAFTSAFGRRHVSAVTGLLRDGEIRVRSVVKLAEPDPVGEDGEEAAADLDEASIPSEDEAELLKRVLRQLTRLDRAATKIDELVAEQARMK